MTSHWLGISFHLLFSIGGLNLGAHTPLSCFYQRFRACSPAPTSWSRSGLRAYLWLPVSSLRLPVSFLPCFPSCIWFSLGGCRLDLPAWWMLGRGSTRGTDGPRGRPYSRRASERAGAQSCVTCPQWWGCLNVLLLSWWQLLDGHPQGVFCGCSCSLLSKMSCDWGWRGAYCLERELASNRFFFFFCFVAVILNKIHGS